MRQSNQRFRGRSNKTNNEVPRGQEGAGKENHEIAHSNIERKPGGAERGQKDKLYSERRGKVFATGPPESTKDVSSGRNS